MSPSGLDRDKVHQFHVPGGGGITLHQAAGNSDLAFTSVVDKMAGAEAGEQENTTCVVLHHLSSEAPQPRPAKAMEEIVRMAVPAAEQAVRAVSAGNEVEEQEEDREERTLTVALAHLLKTVVDTVAAAEKDAALAAKAYRFAATMMREKLEQGDEKEEGKKKKKGKGNKRKDAEKFEEDDTRKDKRKRSKGYRRENEEEEEEDDFPERKRRRREKDGLRYEEEDGKGTGKRGRKRRRDKHGKDVRKLTKGN